VHWERLSETWSRPNSKHQHIRSTIWSSPSSSTLESPPVPAYKQVLQGKKQMKWIKGLLFFSLGCSISLLFACSWRRNLSSKFPPFSRLSGKRGRCSPAHHSTHDPTPTPAPPTTSLAPGNTHNEAVEHVVVDMDQSLDLNRTPQVPIDRRQLQSSGHRLRRLYVSRISLSWKLKDCSRNAAPGAGAGAAAQEWTIIWAFVEAGRWIAAEAPEIQQCLAAPIHAAAAFAP
jgi:hypothetical protein